MQPFNEIMRLIKKIEKDCKTLDEYERDRVYTRLINLDISFVSKIVQDIMLSIDWIIDESDEEMEIKVSFKGDTKKGKIIKGESVFIEIPKNRGGKILDFTVHKEVNDAMQ